MTIAIHITEHCRVWPAEEIAALGDVRTLADLERALTARGYCFHDLAHSGDVMRATVEHDVPAVTGESVTTLQILDIRDRDASLWRTCEVALYGADARAIAAGDTRKAARARCAASINARRGAR